MIRFSLRCDQGHRFDSWFASGGDFDRLRQAAMLSCAVCGTDEVEKDLMAPQVATGATPVAPERPEAPAAPLSAPASPAEQALRELRARIEAASDNVGRDFAREARRIHAGEAPERPIIGEARVTDARALLEDGIPVAPLPWSSRRAN